MNALRAEAGTMRDLGFKPFPMNPADPKKPHYKRLPWTNVDKGTVTWKKTRDARYAGTYGITTDEELDLMFPDEQSGLALAVGRLSATEWRILVDFDVKGRLRAESLLVRQLLFQHALKSKGVTLPDNTPLSETGSGGLHAYLAATMPVSVELGDKYGSIPWVQSTEMYTYVDANGKSQTRPVWVIELKALGYGVEAPTIHTSGTPYRWVTRPQAPIPFAPAALVQALIRKPQVRAPREPGTVHDVPDENLALAVEALAAIWHPASGHTAAQALGGWLGKNNVSEETTLALMEDLCHAAGDTNEIANRVNAARDSWNAAQDDERAYGYPTLAKQLGQEPLARVAQKIKTWLQFHRVEVVIVPTIGGGTDPVITVTEPPSSFDDFLERLRHPAPDLAYMPTGPASLDTALGGYLRKMLHVTIAETGVGKTILQAQQNRTLAEAQEVVHIEREMTADQIWLRLVAAEAQMNAMQLTDAYRGKTPLDATSWRQIEYAAKTLRALKLTIYGNDYPLDLSEWDNMLRVLDRHPNAAVLQYDIFQRLHARERMEPGRFEADEKIHGLKQLAVERNLAVAVTCHPSRPIKTATEHTSGDTKLWYPSIHSGLESNQIEGTADVMILLARHLHSPMPKERHDLRWRLGKARDGITTPWASWTLDLRSLRILDTKDSMAASTAARADEEPTP